MPAQTSAAAAIPASPSSGDNGPPPAVRPRSPWPAVDAAKIREALARAVDSTRGSPPTPAMDFGAFARKDLDATPAWNLGASAVAKLLRLDPHGKAIGKLEAQMVVANRETEILRNRVHQLHTQKFAGKRQSAEKATAKSVRGRKRCKEVTVKEASEKLRAKVNAILVQMRNAGRTEGEIERELIEKVYSLYDYQHAEKCGYSEKAAKTFYRTPEYTSWKRYRPRGNAARLDPTSAAVDFTSTGGRSSKTGTSRNAQFAAKNNLSVGRGGRLPELTAEAREKMAKVPGASEWYEQNRDKLEDLSDSEEFADNP